MKKLQNGKMESAKEERKIDKERAKGLNRMQCQVRLFIYRVCLLMQMNMFEMKRVDVCRLPPVSACERVCAHVCVYKFACICECMYMCMCVCVKSI